MDELSPDARSALNALREDLPDDSARDRMRQRVLAASAGVVAGTVAAGSAQAASAGAQVSSASLSAGAGAAGGALTSLSVSKLVIVMASLGAVGVGAGVLRQDAVSSRRQADMHHTAQVIARAAPTERTAPSEEPFILGPTAEPVVSANAGPTSSGSGRRGKPANQRSPSPSASLGAKDTEVSEAVTEPVEQPAEVEGPAVPREAPPTSSLRESEGAPDLAPEAAARSLQAESALLRGALATFEAGRVCEALALLDRYQREFGESARLAPEQRRMRTRFMQTEARCDAPKGTLP